jgi:POT family proton-dependent oligopeptide transporter
MDQPKLPATSPAVAPPSDGYTDTPLPPVETNGEPAAPPAEPPLTPEGYRTAPDHNNPGWPPGVPYIVGNEACERFSYYGMRAILQVHLISLYVTQVVNADDARRYATQTVHLFMAGVYALPMIGALIADRWAGKYKTILYLSLVYCAGHAVLSLYESALWGMYLGLALIAVGSGGIKPCVSANVGDQFGRANMHRVRTIYQIFYFSINFGSFFATLLIPYLRSNAGYVLIERFPETFGSADPLRLGTSIAFGLPGVLMFLATFIFWLGRRQFVHAPPRPGGQLGLLDACCSVALFLSLGHLFFTRELMVDNVFPGNHALAWGALAGISVVFLAIGLYLFNLRQRIAPDDGFLSITLHVLLAHLGLKKDRAPAPAAPPPAPSVAAADTAVAQSAFWRPAVERFGLAATEGPVAVFKIISVFFLVSVFWALFDQHSSTWITQAGEMDLWLWGQGRASFLGIGNVRLEASQVPALNPLLVMLLIPLMNLVYHLFDRAGIQTTPLRRITVGMWLTALSFVATALLQMYIDAERAAGRANSVWVGWQIVQYVIVTIGEVMVSITGLEFAYTQAPKKMKSTVMGFWLLTVTFGNVLVAFLAGFKGLNAADFFWVFAGLSGAAALIFGLRAYFYVPKDYTQ